MDNSNTERGQDNQNRQTVLRIHFRKNKLYLDNCQQYSDISRVDGELEMRARNGELEMINTTRNEVVQV